MSVSTQITRINNNRNNIRTKLVELGLSSSIDNLDALAIAISGIGPDGVVSGEGIVNRGAVNVNVKEGESYTIPKGYHNGSGTVSGVSGGGNYTLQAKTVTPTKMEQAIAPDSGYYGLSGITVAAIPDNYQDVSSVTATAADVLTTKVFVTREGASTAGTMPNNGTVTQVLDTTTTSKAIAKGYHSGSGSVSISLEEKTVTPTESTQNVTPTTGKVLSKVTVNAIPSNYKSVNSLTEYYEGMEEYIADGDIVLTKTTNTSTGTVTPKVVTGEMVILDAMDVVFDTTTDLSGNYTNTGQGEYFGGGYLPVSSFSIVPQTKTVTSSNVTQTVSADKGKVLASVTVNGMASGALATPTISSTGLVTAKVSTSGYLAANESKTYQLSTQAAKTITPSTVSQTAVVAGKYTTGNITVDAIPTNYGNTSDATATAADILSGKIAYGKDSSGKAIKLTGTINQYTAKNKTLDASTDSEGEYNNTSCVIENGYHAAGSVQISVQDKTITSSNTAQTVTPDSGKVLGKVTVNAMGAGAFDTISVSTAGVVTAKIKTAGYMSTTDSKTLQLSTQAAKTITPTTSSQTVVTSGKYTTGAITVAAIPSEYVNSSTVTATANQVLAGTKAVVKSGSSWVVADGTMTNQGAKTITLTGLGAVDGDCSQTLGGGYYSSISVSITDDIETQLAAI